MAGSNTPAWRQAFNKAERAIGEPLEKAIDTREFADMMSFGAKVRKGFQRQIYGTVNRSLHFVGLSTLKDTRDIARQLNRVHAQLREVSTQLEYLEEREQSREDSESRTSVQSSAHAPAPAKKTAPANAPAPAPTPAEVPPSASASPDEPAKAPAKATAPAKPGVKKVAPAKKTTPSKPAQNDSKGA